MLFEGRSHNCLVSRVSTKWKSLYRKGARLVLVEGLIKWLSRGRPSSRKEHTCWTVHSSLSTLNPRLLVSLYSLVPINNHYSSTRDGGTCPIPYDHLPDLERPAFNNKRREKPQRCGDIKEQEPPLWRRALLKNLLTPAKNQPGKLESIHWSSQKCL